MNTPVLETKRLILRKFTQEDLEALFLILKDEEVNKFLPWYPIKNLEETQKFYEERYATEAGRAVIEQVKKDGMSYITATHDRNNPRSGMVMRACGMKYCYTYEEQWQPKDFPVFFRMYQLNFDGNEDFVYKKYWDKYDHHFVEELD